MGRWWIVVVAVVAPVLVVVGIELVDNDPPPAHGSVLEGSNVVAVRVESFADPEGPVGLVVPTVADIANAYALALVDEERLAVLNKELAVAGDRDDPQVEAMALWPRPVCPPDDLRLA